MAPATSWVFLHMADYLQELRGIHLSCWLCSLANVLLFPVLKLYAKQGVHANEVKEVVVKIFD